MQEHLEFPPDKVVPRRFGHGLSLPPGIGLGPAENTGGKGLGRFGQSTFRSTIPHPAQRKRRAGSQMTTDSDLQTDAALEGTHEGHTTKEGSVWTWLLWE